MIAVLAYLRALPMNAEPRRRWLAAALALFIAAVLCHAVAVSLPVVLMILDVYPLRALRRGPRAMVW